jgi:hypothetical protein
MYVPLLPYRYNDKLYFPTGKFEGYWDNELLRKAYELGYKIEPKKAYVFRSEKLFTEYIDKFYKLKQRSKQKSAPYLIAKLLMNSLYGKFGQSQESEKLVKALGKDEIDKLEIINAVDIDCGLFKAKTESKGTHFIPQISLHVTALAQLVLYEFIERILDKGKLVAYCDTDSIFTDLKLPTSKKLGDMKLEYDFKRGYFLRPKNYYIVKDKKDKTKAKGYSKEFQKKLTESSYKKALFKKDYSDFTMVSEDVINPMKSSYRRHGSFTSVDKRRKSILKEYDKRNILKDFNTKPKNIKDIICNYKI